MKRLFLLLNIFILTLTLGSRADEGMWIPMFIDRLNYEDMQKLGLRLTAEEIYSVNNSSLKDAIVIFGRGCTGEIVSDQGLLFTNHHCGFGQIQSHSTIEHDYLTDGFWARSLEEELPNPGLTVQFLVKIEDVTSKVMEQLSSDMSDEERSAMIDKVTERLVKSFTDDTHYNAVVRPFFGGNEYYLFLYETYKDVRLVGAPPSSIGKFGGDTDNWMWPRHTGDFSIFRVYTGPDGKPAEYSKDNVPLKPKHYLPVSLEGYKEGDFSMILGYPGSTDRYLTSEGVRMATDISNPAIVKIRQEKLDIINADMAASDQVRIQYATKKARISNYWKYFIGQTRGLKRLKVEDEKRKIEAEFTAWLKEDPVREAKYGKALPDIMAAYDTLTGFALSSMYYREAGLRGAEITGFAYRFNSLANQMEQDKIDLNKFDDRIAKYRESVREYFKDYNAATDKKLLARMMEMFYNDVPKDQQPAYLIEMAGKFKGDWDAYADYIFEKSIFASEDKVNALLDAPSVKVIRKDPAYAAYVAFNDKSKELQDQTKASLDKLSKGNRLFIAGLREMHPDRKFYPDANFTMRLSYGTVQDYFPADAVYYSYFTTLEGVMEKDDPDDPEFIVPERLRKLYREKDYGPYGVDGVMHTCFLTNHDITGGNSGSPVINGRGELIGLAFDGNWEAMSGDIAYEPELQRTINVDVRYVLFIIDKFAGAKNLIKELTIVTKPEEEKVPAAAVDSKE